mgnify:FL=1
MKVKKIIILGGGSAGWMTAAMFIKAFPKKDITVIESKNIKTVGVGESTLGHINHWLDFLGIKDKDFMPFTKASYKLSIRFEDFYKKGDGGYHYPFGQVAESENTSLKEIWFYKKLLNKKIHKSDYANFISPQMALVNNNVLFKNENGELPFYNFKYDVAYHFDAAKFGEWLKTYYCKPKGVKHIVDDVETIQQNQNGITSLNKKYKADLFIDCTGFKSLLLGQTLKEPFNSYSDLLPNNKAWATSLPYKNKEKELKPYTNCTAINNGWVWNIPSWDKIGTGYVYSDKFISDQEALKEFKQYLKKKGSDYSKSTFNNISMKVGIHKRIFVKNVCAIGLSAGFIEPLESNGLLSVHEFLFMLINVLQRGSVSQWDRDNFNHTARNFFDGFVEFISYHYALSHRTDTPYWKAINKKSFYDRRLLNTGLEKNIECYMNNNDRFRSDAGVHYISTGMNYLKYNFLKLNDNIKNKIKQRQEEVKRWNNICKNKTSLLKFLKENIYNEI